MDRLHQKIAGSLYGLLVGDALGCPVEGWSARKIRAEYGVLSEMVEATERWRPCGLHSDDGQQALALCQALLDDPFHAPSNFADLLVAMYQEGPRGRGYFGLHRGTGMMFRKTVKLLESGASGCDAAQASAGNGVAMMIAPVAWYWREDADAMGDCIVAVGALKQRDIRGIAAAAGVAYVTRHALLHADWSRLSHQEMVGFVRGVEQKAAAVLASDLHSDAFSVALAEMLENLDGPRDSVLVRIGETADRTADRSCSPVAGYALASPITSIYLALTASTFEQALLDTVNLGGDTDTTGAMVGAMAGAMHGWRAIPSRWYDKLVAKGAFDAWIEPLIRQDVQWAPAPGLLELEKAWNRPYVRGSQGRGRP